jgi:two-component system response regulator HydG/two-component system response regulator AtoC
LRVLEAKTLQPVGSDTDQSVDVRIVSATNRDLRGEGSRRFRDDLFYRLKMFHVHVPPLRERMSDLPLLVAHLLRSLTDEEVLPRITPSAWAALTHHDFPGNVRELRHALGHAVVVAGGDAIDARHLPGEFRCSGVSESASGGAIQPLEMAGREFERDYLLRTLQATDWNKTRAAEILGISRKTLWKKLRDLKISKPA